MENNFIRELEFLSLEMENATLRELVQLQSDQIREHEKLNFRAIRLIETYSDLIETHITGGKR